MSLQQNIKKVAQLLPFLVLALAASAVAGTRGPAAPDPILAGAPANPCLEVPDYVAGIDTGGNPVVPADLPSAAPPLADGAVITHVRGRHGQDAEVAVDLSRLAEPSCDRPPPRR